MTKGKLAIESVRISEQGHIEVKFNKPIEPQKAIDYFVEAYKHASGNTEIHNGHPVDEIGGKVGGIPAFAISEERGRSSLFEMYVEDLNPRTEFCLDKYHASDSEREAMKRKLEKLATAA